MATLQVPIALVAPDVNGNAYPLLIAGTVHRHVVPAFVKDVVGEWSGIFRVPQNYLSTPHVILALGANATTGVTSFAVSTKRVPNNDTSNTYNPGTYTTETTIDTTVPATAYTRKDVDFTLTLSGIAAGDDIVIKVAHKGTDANDTLAVDTILFNCVFQYTG